jgi:membrane protein YqaA with SNARE-associated domain
MQRLKEAITLFAQSLGLPGLALITFLDSSFLTFPEVPDIWLMGLVATNKSEWLWYAAVTTGSSIAGCYVLYELARRGGETFLRRRLHERHIERGLAAFRKYGLLTVVVPSILPPPMPFKPFVLLAGMAKVRPPVFLLALVIGRGFRYGMEAILAYRYGEAAIDYVNRHLASVSIALAATVAVIGLAFIIWKRTRRDA